MAEDPPPTPPDSDMVDPVEFLRRMLAISPEEAAEVREDAAKRTAEDERRERQPPAQERGT